MVSCIMVHSNAFLTRRAKLVYHQYQTFKGLNVLHLTMYALGGFTLIFFTLYHTYMEELGENNVSCLFVSP